MNNPLYHNLFGVHSENDDPFLFLLDGQTITYRKFLAKSRQIANSFFELGLEPGDCIAIQVEKSPEMLNIYAACAQAGLVFLPLNPAYTVDELKYFIENSEARLIICDEKNKEDLSAITQQIGIGLETLNSNSTGTILEKASSASEYFTTVPRTQTILQRCYTLEQPESQKGHAYSIKPLIERKSAYGRVAIYQRRHATSCAPIVSHSWFVRCD